MHSCGKDLGMVYRYIVLMVPFQSTSLSINDFCPYPSTYLKNWTLRTLKPVQLQTYNSVVCILFTTWSPLAADRWENRLWIEYKLHTLVFWCLEANALRYFADHVQVEEREWRPPSVGGAACDLRTLSLWQSREFAYRLVTELFCHGPGRQEQSFHTFSLCTVNVHV